MKQYEKYKNSGVEWVGKIPVHWDVKRLKFNTYIKARVGWHGLRADEFSLSEGVFCVTGTDFIDGEINWENCYRVSPERYEEDPYIQLRVSDLLITKDGTIGKVAVVKQLKEKATLNSGVFVVRPERMEYITPFMYWALQSPIFFEYVDYTSKGSTINHLYQETFFNLPFLLPSLDEQTAIAAYLDEKTARIDKLIANKQRLIELLKEERTAVVKKAVRYGINENEELTKSNFDWFDRIPKSWIKTAIKYIAQKTKDSVVDGPFGSSVNIDTDYVLEGIPVVRTVNITEKGFSEDDLRFMRTEKFNELKRHAVYPGDVLFSKVGTIGNCCVFPNHIPYGILSTTGSCKITVNPEYITSEYLVYLLKAMKEHFLLLASSNVQPFLNMATIKNVRIAIPSVEMQKQIIEFLKKRLSEIDLTISKIEKEIELMQEYRTALISEVVTGKIKVI